MMARWQNLFRTQRGRAVDEEGLHPSSLGHCRVAALTVLGDFPSGLHFSFLFYSSLQSYTNYNYLPIIINSKMADIEAGETTPLVGGASADEPPPLQDMKAESLKERTVMAGGGVSCKCVSKAMYECMRAS